VIQFGNESLDRIDVSIGEEFRIAVPSRLEGTELGGQVEGVWHLLTSKRTDRCPLNVSRETDVV
jgi:hypothetical protein